LGTLIWKLQLLEGREAGASGAALELHSLVPKLPLGNPDLEALASRGQGSWSFRGCIRATFLGSQAPAWEP